MKWRLYRVWAGIRKLVCQLRRRHTSQGGDWGYALSEQFGRKGVVEVFCPNCMQLVCHQPLDDFDRTDEVLAVVDLARSLAQ